MSSSRFYVPETVGHMTTVYKRAVQELKIERASIVEHERLASCVLSIGNTYTDPDRLLDESIRLYLRSFSMGHNIVLFRRHSNTEQKKITRRQSCDISAADVSRKKRWLS